MSSGVDTPTEASDSLEQSELEQVEAARRIGRFTILRQLGQGGMGAVFTAYDEQLDRKVALKLLRTVANDRSRGRMLREAQAMAKIDHPNVVKVFEVGEHQEQPYIAMEFVDGQDLLAWQAAEEPPWRDALAAYLQAGRGLAAAHALGLVHRDFKPQNAMIDRLGAPRRVRVLDFGLVAGAAEGLRAQTTPTETDEPNDVAPLTKTGSLMGTPAYMSPEQFGGMPITHLSDQFSFCVAMWEALYGQRPFEAPTVPELCARVLAGHRQPPPERSLVPRRLRESLERGLSVAPEERWPDMESLLEALAPAGSGYQRWLWWAGGGAALAVGIAFGTAGGDDTCRRAPALLDELWTDGRRASLASTLSAVDVSFAERSATETVEGLDAYADRWRAARIEACEATLVRGERSTEEMLARERCLDHRLAAMKALVEVLEEPDVYRLERAPTSVASLPEVRLCSEAGFVEALVAPPDDEATAQEVRDTRMRLAEAAALRESTDFAAALVLAEQALVTAEGIGYPPLLVEAHNEMAEIFLEDGRHEEGRKHARLAYVQSSKASVESRARNYRLLARLAWRSGDPLESWTHAHKALIVLKDELGPDDPQVLDAWALYVASLGWVGDVEGGVEESRAFLAARQADDETSVAKLAEAYRLYATALDHAGQYDLAVEQGAQSLELYTRAYGPEHPRLATVLNDYGVILQNAGKDGEAYEAAKRALTIVENTYGAKHPLALTAQGNVASSLANLGRHEEALAIRLAQKTALEEIHEGNHISLAYALNGIGRSRSALGHPKEARADFEEALQVAIDALGPEHRVIITFRSNVAGAMAETGDYEGALEMRREVLAQRVRQLGEKHPDVASSYGQIANSLHDLGRTAEALQYQERSLQARIELLGPEHPDVAISRNNLATLLGKLGRRNEALEQYRLALEIRERVLPPDHPYIAMTYNNIGFSLRHLDDLEGAEQNYEKALELQLPSLGKDHPDVALSNHNLGAIRSELGKPEAALANFAEATRIYDELYGAHHHHVTSTRIRYGQALLDADRVDEALEQARLAVESANGYPASNPARDLEAVAILAVLEAKFGERADSMRHLERLRRASRDNPDQEVNRALFVVTNAVLQSGLRRVPTGELDILREASLHGLPRVIEILEA